MIVDIILGIAVIVLGIANIMQGRMVRQLLDVRRPVDLLEHQRRRATLILTTRHMREGDPDKAPLHLLG